MESPAFMIYSVLETNSGIQAPPTLFLEPDKDKAVAYLLKRANDLWRTQATTFFRVEDVEQFQKEVETPDSLEIFCTGPFKYEWSELPSVDEILLERYARKQLESDKRLSEAWNDLGNTLKDMGHELI